MKNIFKKIGRQPAPPTAPPTPEFKTIEVRFEELPGVALYIPHETTLAGMIRIGAEVSRQMSMKAFLYMDQQLAKVLQGPQRILPPEEPAAVAPPTEPVVADVPNEAAIEKMTLGE